MALRLYSEFHSDQGDLYKVEIHDTDWLGAAYSFELGGDGFTLDYSGQTDDLISPVISSACTFDMAVRTGQTLNFLNALKTYQEKRFRVRIYRSTMLGRAVDSGLVAEPSMAFDGAEAYSLYWVGWITQDLVEIEDYSEPYFLTITASDFAQLGELTLNPSVASDQTLHNVFEYCIDRLGLDDLYDAEAYLATCVNWWEDSMVYSTSSDVSKLLRFNTATFYSKEEDGTWVYPSCMEVLSELATIFNARIYQKEGCFYFEQYGERVNVSRNVFFYDKTATLLRRQTISDDVTLDKTTAWGARLAGNAFNYMPALKKVVATYENELTNNLLVSGRLWTSSNTLEEVGIVADDNNAQLLVRASGKYAVTYNGSGATVSNYFYIPVFRMTLRLEDVNTPGSYWYLKRDYNGYNTATPYGVTSWTTTASYYYFDLGQNQIQAQGQIYIQDITILSPPLPIDGSLSFDIDLYQTYNLSGGSSSLPANYSATWSFTNTSIEYLVSGNNAASVIQYSASSSSATIGSNLTLELGSLRLADAFYLMLGSIQVYNGSAWVNSNLWRKGNSGTYVKLLNLLTKEVLALYYAPVERYQGRMVGAHPFGFRIGFDSKFWLPTGGQFNANQGEWDCEWYAIAYDATSITNGTAIEDRTVETLGIRTSSNDGGVNVGFFDAGRIAGMEIDKANSSLGPFEEVTGGGKINGFIQLDTTFTPNGEAPGGMFWNDDTGTMAVVMADGEFLDTGEKTVWQVKNQTGSTITKGTAVAANGTLGASGRILITPMKGDGTIAAKYFLGLANADIASGDDGYVVSAGKIRQLDTSAFTEGAVLWVHPTNAGELTATEPTAPNLKLPVAFVVYADANGTLAIRQTAGTYLSESHDVKISSPVSGELLARTGSNVWENVELGSLFNAGTDVPSTEAGESFSQFYGGNSGNVLGEPTKWFRITIGGTDYVIPLYLPA